jgi:hypothetical protein
LILFETSLANLHKLRTSREEGIQIDESEEQSPNANLAIQETLESLSNVTIDSDAQVQKAEGPMRDGLEPRVYN